MPQGSDKPVVFLTFANAAEQGYLSQLKKESALLRDLFLPLHRAGQVELVREESLDAAELPKLLNQYKGRITLFHYGGHANGSELSLEGGGGYIAGLAQLLSLQKGLKLAFLNGCSTQEQTLSYLNAGVPAVLATNRSIPDKDAIFFAEHFYHALLNQHTIREAFLSASGALRARSSQYGASPGSEITVFRGAGFEEEKLEEMPWRLYAQEGNEAALDWALIDNKVPTIETKGRKERLWRWVVGVGVVIGILAGIVGITGFDLKSLLGMAQTDSPLQLTVYVHGPRGRQDIVLENEGKLILDLRNDRRVAQIGEHGRTNFGEVSRDFLGKGVPLSIQAEGFVMAHPDTAYNYDGEPIYLAVQRDKNMGLIHGIVKGDNGNGLESVTVLVENDTVVLTDSLGRFRASIPEEKIREEYQLTFQKEGYQNKTRAYYPNSNLFEVELAPVINQ